jgi:hypothetical protein
MPYVQHVKITARFSLGSPTAPAESASCTLSFTPGTAGFALGSVRQDIVNDAFDDWATWVNATGARVLQDVRLDECRLYVIGTDGHSMYDTAISEGTPVQGASPRAYGHPWQNSLVMTLVSGTRGKGRFGRIYLPPQTYGINQDGTINAADHTAMFTATHQLLTDLSGLPGLDTGWGLAIAGKTGSGTLRTVDQVRFGHVADTQRRRRRSLDEAYATAAFTA